MNEEDRKTESIMTLVAIAIVLAVIIAIGYFFTAYMDCMGDGFEYKQTPDGPACVATGK